MHCGLLAVALILACGSLASAAEKPPVLPAPIQTFSTRPANGDLNAKSPLAASPTYSSFPCAPGCRLRPKCAHARAVATRPFGVRARKPSWMRYGS